MNYTNVDCYDGRKGVVEGIELSVVEYNGRKYLTSGKSIVIDKISYEVVLDNEFEHTALVREIRDSAILAGLDKEIMNEYYGALEEGEFER
jgi:hypothetical protein